MHLTKRLQALKPSETVAITAQARALRAQGHDVIVLAAGEPDFAPPAHIREAVAEEARSGVTRYGPATGTLEVREAVAAYLNASRGTEYGPDSVILTNGGKHALFEALAGLVEEGDEALILAPYWVTYPAQVELLGCVPTYLSADDSQGFKVTPEQLQDALGPRTRCVIFNNPCNPTGTLYAAEEVKAITEVCLEADVAIVSDEVYDAIIFEGGPYLSPTSVSPRARDNTVIASSLSKAYAMPGWRIGYLAGPQEWIKKVGAFQGQITHHPSQLAQAAALAAFQGDQTAVEEMRRAFLARRNFLLKAFEAIPGFDIAVPPQGAFYLFPRITELIKALPGVEGSADACSWLLEQAKVALVPGAAFGAEGFLRLSYAASEDDLRTSVERIGEAVLELGID